MTTASPDLPPTARLFIGLWPDAGVREQLSEWQAVWTRPAAARLTRPERMHLTVHFLGEVERERVAVLGQALELPFERFELRLDACELWSGGVAVARATTTPLPLTRLHERLRKLLQALDQPTARLRLAPHVTLARKAEGAAPPERRTVIHWAVEGYALIESQQSPRLQYRTLYEYA